VCWINGLGHPEFLPEKVEARQFCAFSRSGDEPNGRRWLQPPISLAVTVAKYPLESSEDHHAGRGSNAVERASRDAPVRATLCLWRVRCMRIGLPGRIIDLASQHTFTVRTARPGWPGPSSATQCRDLDRIGLRSVSPGTSPDPVSLNGFELLANSEHRRIGLGVNPRRHRGQANLAASPCTRSASLQPNGSGFDATISRRPLR
jgi:hypothetical protein